MPDIFAGNRSLPILETGSNQVNLHSAILVIPKSFLVVRSFAQPHFSTCYVLLFFTVSLIRSSK